MNEERWRQIEELYHSAREREAGGRSAFLHQACQGDVELRREVEALLAQGDAVGDSTVTILTPGAQLGPYQIEAPIGAGGMGSVYRAVDTRLGRKVAIKICAQQFSGRFEREARAISSLNHPHICTLYDVGPNYLVMELVEGETLAARLQKGRLPMAVVLRYAAEIADALAAAHALGIIHRDLKPQNIMVTKSGVKVLDFGLAKSPRDQTLTATRVVMGTPAYMAPEQMEGKECDARSDIYALGLVLYEMAAGKRLPRGQTPVMEGLPLQLAHVIGRCLESEPENRWQSASDVKRELEWAGRTQPAAAPVPADARRQVRTRPLPWLVAAALAGGVAIWGWLRTPPAEPRPVARWTATLPAPDPLLGSGLAISHDGTGVAYAERTGGSLRIWVRVLDQPEGKPTPGTEGGLRPFFSPDGQWLAYFTGAVGPLKKVPVTGGTPITLCEGAGYFGGSWGEDGSIIFTGSSGLMRVSASGGKCENLTRTDPQKRELHNWPQILPGGEAILFTIGTGGTSFDGARIAALDLKSGGIRVLVNGASAARYVPSGHLVYVRGGTMFAVPFDLKQLVATGPETPVIEGVFYNMAGGFADYAFSNSGLLVYRAETRTGTGATLEWLDRKGAAQALPAPPQQYMGVRLSPDGQHAAVVIRTGGAGGRADIWICELARGALTRLTSAGGIGENPVWTPDGRRVAFTNEQDGKTYWVPADGSGRPEQLLPSQEQASPGSWTPDGKMLLYNSGAPAHIWTLQVPGSGGESKPQPVLETSFNEVDAQVSPDGRWVAYTSDESGKNQVYARPFPGRPSGPGGKTSISIEGGQEPRWSRDGRELFYRDARKNQLMAVDIQTNPALRAGQPRALFELRTASWDVAPDGKRFLVVKEPETAAGEAKMQVVVNWFEELRQKAPRR
jgi:Tol biopolymer transport system component/predicted Ser/Thr protein kinase